MGRELSRSYKGCCSSIHTPQHKVNEFIWPQNIGSAALRSGYQAGIGSTRALHHKGVVVECWASGCIPSRLQCCRRNLG